MIRFVDFGTQLFSFEKRFGWYDTVTDKFVECSGNVSWDSFDDFSCDFNGATGYKSSQRGGLDWFKELFPPDWPPVKNVTTDAAI